MGDGRLNSQWRFAERNEIASRSGDVGLARQQIADAVVGVDRAETVERVLQLFETGGDPLDRNRLPDHLTASAAVVDPTRGMLLLHHQKLDRWLQPGGHVDGDGNLLSAALREAEEESGLSILRGVLPAIDVDIHDVAYPDGSFHIHHDIRFLMFASGEVTINHESRAAAWVRNVDKAALLGGDESVLRLVRVALQVAETLSSPF